MEELRVRKKERKENKQKDYCHDNRREDNRREEIVCSLTDSYSDVDAWNRFVVGDWVDCNCGNFVKKKKKNTVNRWELQFSCERSMRCGRTKL